MSSHPGLRRSNTLGPRGLWWGFFNEGTNMDHREVENSLYSGATDDYELGPFWLRKQHRKVDPDMEHELSLPHADDKPAHQKTMWE